MKIKFSVITIICLGMMAFLPCRVFAHCDTMNGPVIADARQALEKGDITPALKWVKPDKEAELKKAFDEVLAESKKGQAAKEKAEMRFFETLVRIHREGEGAEFSGLKPAGSELEPGVGEADVALEQGSAEDLIKLVTEHTASGIRKRFDEALEKKKHKDESVEAGREFVEAYVEYVHYVENLHKAVSGKGAHHEE